jgi:hypothetical protein
MIEPARLYIFICCTDLREIRGSMAIQAAREEWVLFDIRRSMDRIRRSTVDENQGCLR